MVAAAAVLLQFGEGLSEQRDLVTQSWLIMSQDTQLYCRPAGMGSV